MSNINDVGGLMKALGHNHKQEKWQLLTNATKAILKGVMRMLNR
jgi:hypothetical protein